MKQRLRGLMALLLALAMMLGNVQVTSAYDYSEGEITWMSFVWNDEGFGWDSSQGYYIEYDRDAHGITVAYVGYNTVNGSGVLNTSEYTVEVKNKANDTVCSSLPTEVGTYETKVIFDATEYGFSFSSGVLADLNNEGGGIYSKSIEWKIIKPIPEIDYPNSYTHGDPAISATVTGLNSGDITTEYTGDNAIRYTYYDKVNKKTLDAFPTEPGRYDVTIDIPAVDIYAGTQITIYDFRYNAKKLTPQWDNNIKNYTGGTIAHKATIPQNQIVGEDVVSVQYYDPRSYPFNDSEIRTYADSATDIGKYYNGISKDLQGKDARYYELDTDISHYNNSEYIGVDCGGIYSKWEIKEGIIDGISAQDMSVEYDGLGHNISIEGVPNDATVTYCTEENGIYKSSLGIKDVGEHTVYYKVAKTNYTTFTGSATLTITPRELTPKISGRVTKVYDGSTDVPSGHSLSVGIDPSGKQSVSGETVSINTSSLSYNYSDKGVGTNKEVKVSNIELTGTNAANYTIAATATANVGEITAKPLTAQLAGSITKEYDGTNVAAEDSSYVELDGICVTDDVSADISSCNYTFADANAGNSKNVTVTGIALAGDDKGNYVLASTTASGNIGIISQKEIVPVWDTTTSYAYDGNSHSHKATIPDSQLIAADKGKVSLKYEANANYSGTADYAASATAVGNYYNCFSTYTLEGEAAGNYKVSEYSSDYPQGTKIYSGGICSEWSIQPAGMTDVTASDTVCTYDGNAHNISVLAPEGSTIKYSETGADGSYVDNLNIKDVCTNKVIYYEVSKANYKTVNGSRKLTIKPAELTAVIDGSVTKTYDRTTSVSGPSENTLSLKFSDATKTAIVSGEDVSINTTGVSYSYDDANKGTAKTITASGIALTGSDAGNYKLTADTATADVGTINAKNITASFADGAAVSKVYDGTTTIIGEKPAIVITGQIAGDDVDKDVSACTYKYADANAGSSKLVTASEIALKGNDAGNYYLVSSIIVDTIGTITRKKIVPVWDASTVSVKYDGNSHSHTATIPDGQLIAADKGKVSLKYGENGNYPGTANYAESATTVGNYYNSFSTDTLEGTAAGNYMIDTSTSYPNASLVSGGIYSEWSIQPAGMSDVTASDTVCTYDGNAHNISVLAPEGSTIKYSETGADGSYVDNLNIKDVCTNKVIYYEVTKANYTNKKGSAKLTIKPAELTAVIDGSVTKTYDKTTSVAGASANTLSLKFSDATKNAIVSGENVSIDTTSITYTYDNANKGVAKTITASGIALKGSDKGNYKLTAVTATANVGTINAKTLTASFADGAVVSKEYDGTTAVIGEKPEIVITGQISGDKVDKDISGCSYSYDNADAGSGKLVTVSGIALGGADKDNYILASTSVSKNIGTITRKKIVPVWDASTVSVKYDGNSHSHTATIPDDQLIAADKGKVSLIYKENDSYEGDSEYKATATDVGSYYNNFSAYTLEGAAAGNYMIDTSASYPNASIISGGICSEWSITPADMSGVTASDKVYTYDGNAHNISVLAPQGATVKYSLTENGTYVDEAELNIKDVCDGKVIYYQVTKANYTPVEGSKKLTIKPAELTAVISGSVTKTYDRTTSVSGATANTLGLKFSDATKTAIVSGEDVTIDITGVSYSYDNANKGSGKTITASGIALKGSDKGNYKLTSATAEAKVGTIVPKKITASISGETNKAYDGNKTADKGSIAITLNDVVEGSQVLVDDSNIKYTYDDANVASKKKVNVEGIALAGEDKDNYELESTVVSAAIGTITKADMNVIATDKEYTYDGAAHNIDVTAPENTIIKYSDTEDGKYTESLDIKNVCSDKVIYYEVTGSNYNTYKGSAKLTIKPAELTATLSGETSKNYDGNTTATKGTLKVSLTGVVSGDDVVADDTACTYTYDNADAGSGKMVTVANIALAGADKDNYILKSSTVADKVGIIVEVQKEAANEPKPLDIKIKGYKGLYDGEPHSVTADIPPYATITYGTEEGDYSLNKAPEFKKVGEYKVYYQVTADGYKTVTGFVTVKNMDNKSYYKVQLNEKIKIYNKDGILCISWGKVDGADGYDIYLRDCDNKPFTKITKSVGAATTTYKTSKVKGKPVSDKKAYKGIIKAYKMVKGKKVMMAGSICVHCVGSNNPTYTNPSKVIVNKKSLTLAKGKKCRISAKIIKQNKNKKLLNHERLIRYISGNKKIARVSSDGKVTALKRGTCKIIVKGLDGTKRIIKVTVR